jgi:cell division septum initiation protein DivIVA
MTIDEALDEAELRVAEATAEAEKAIAAYVELVMSHGPSKNSGAMTAKMNQTAQRVVDLKNQLDAITDEARKARR